MEPGSMNSKTRVELNRPIANVGSHTKIAFAHHNPSASHASEQTPKTKNESTEDTAFFSTYTVSTQPISPDVSNESGSVPVAASDLPDAPLSVESTDARGALPIVHLSDSTLSYGQQDWDLGEEEILLHKDPVSNKTNQEAGGGRRPSGFAKPTRRRHRSAGEVVESIGKSTMPNRQGEVRRPGRRRGSANDIDLAQSIDELRSGRSRSLAQIPRDDRWAADQTSRPISKHHSSSALSLPVTMSNGFQLHTNRNSRPPRVSTQIRAAPATASSVCSSSGSSMAPSAGVASVFSQRLTPNQAAKLAEMQKLAGAGRTKARVAPGGSSLQSFMSARPTKSLQRNGSEGFRSAHARMVSVPAKSAGTNTTLHPSPSTEQLLVMKKLLLGQSVMQETKRATRRNSDKTNMPFGFKAKSTNGLFETLTSQSQFVPTLPHNNTVTQEAKRATRTSSRNANMPFGFKAKSTNGLFETLKTQSQFSPASSFAKNARWEPQENGLLPSFHRDVVLEDNDDEEYEISLTGTLLEKKQLPAKQALRLSSKASLCKPQRHRHRSTPSLQGDGAQYGLPPAASPNSRWNATVSLCSPDTFKGRINEIPLSERHSGDARWNPSDRRAMESPRSLRTVPMSRCTSLGAFRSTPNSPGALAVSALMNRQGTKRTSVRMSGSHGSLTGSLTGKLHDSPRSTMRRSRPSLASMKQDYHEEEAAKSVASAMQNASWSVGRQSGAAPPPLSPPFSRNTISVALRK